MGSKLAVIAIDSLDPDVLLKYRQDLPNLSKIIERSPTFFLKSVFPVDTIPAWASVYTGLQPMNHGLLYTYDVFDPGLNGLKKLDIAYVRGRTFWDYATLWGHRSVIVYPMLMYPSWEINGVMICKSPFGTRKDSIRTEVDVDVSPRRVKDEYKIPDRLESLSGGFPGLKHLEAWAETGKRIIRRESEIGLELFKKEDWNLFFIYFSLLDIIEHRLWRFFDDRDPTYRKSSFSRIILEYYQMFDSIIGDFIEAHPEADMIIMSDHGHKTRPVNTLNINELLRKNGYLVTTRRMGETKSRARRLVLETANKLNIEHLLMKIVTQNQYVAKSGKSVYSSAGIIDKKRSIAYLSDFAGIKSYSHGGIEINREVVSDAEYRSVQENLIKLLLDLNKSGDNSPFLTVGKREDIVPGQFTKEMFPDIVFQLKGCYGVGWELFSDEFGKSYDHMVASGGHSEDAVFLLRNVERPVKKKRLHITDVAPTILDLLGIRLKEVDFDGNSIFSQEE